MYENVKVNSKKWLSLKNLKDEIWKDIPNYEGYYQISNYGRLKSLEKYVNSGIKNNSKVKRKERICTAKINKLGYIHYSLSKNQKYFNINAHYILAELFLSKMNYKYMDYENVSKINLNKLEVNHIDENPTNSRIDNLEWCTHTYNINYGNRNKKVSKAMLNYKKFSKKINQYDLDMNFIKTWNSLKEIWRETGYTRSAISKCCRGIYKQSKGYIWKFVEEKMNINSICNL